MCEANVNGDTISWKYRTGFGVPQLQETAIYNYFRVHMLRIWKNEVQVKI